MAPKINTQTGPLAPLSDQYARGAAPVRSAGPNFAFAAPGAGDRPFNTIPTQPWAPKLHSVPGQTPDPMRTGAMPVRDEYPNPGEPPDNFYHGVHGVARDFMQRLGVEHTVSNGWDTQAPTVKRMALPPRWANQYPEARPATSRKSPNSYTSTRPFDQTYARRFNGNHFSMADHRRTYPVFGMATSGDWRSTTRVDPAPWGANVVDAPDTQPFTPGQQLPQYELPMNQSRWVLNG